MIRRDLVAQECVLSFLLLSLAKNGALSDFVRTPKTARATAPKERRGAGYGDPLAVERGGVGFSRGGAGRSGLSKPHPGGRGRRR